MSFNQAEVIKADLAEYDRLAIALDISQGERCDILSLSAADYKRWRIGDGVIPPPFLMRRLRYAVAIMRRSLANQARPPNYMFSEWRL